MDPFDTEEWRSTEYQPLLSPSEYRRPTYEEIDAALATLAGNERKIDYLRWLLYMDEEAHEIRPEEAQTIQENDWIAIGIDPEGQRNVFDPHSSLTAKMFEVQELRTKAWRAFVTRRINYWQAALTNERPGIVSGLERTSEDPIPVEVSEKTDQSDVDAGVSRDNDMVVDSDAQNRATQPLKWNTEKTALAYLVHRLRREGWLVDSDYDDNAIWKTVERHFVDSNGRPMTNLSQAANSFLNVNSSGAPRLGRKVDEILSDLHDLDTSGKGDSD